MWTALEQSALSILEKLEGHGFEAYFVGGYVRDKLLGRPVKDIDIATAALPEDVVRLFERTIPTGLKHGTVTVLVKGQPFEVTTFRKESDYEKFRRPSEVEFISELNEDLLRRDFTMNAMAMDREGEIRDPFGGRKDMEAHLLRCVGDPHERFHEDALRMLRCIRFASTYDLKIEADTWRALLGRRELLQHVAMERVRAELDRMMEGPQPYRGWRFLADSGLAAYTKVPLSWGYTHLDANKLPPALSVLEQIHDPLLRWMLVMLLSGLSSTEAKDLMRALTFSVKDLEKIAAVMTVREWAEALLWDSVEELSDGLAVKTPEEKWKLGAIRFGLEPLQQFLRLSRTVDSTAKDKGFKLPWILPESVLINGEDWLAEMPVSLAKDLDISGKDILAHTGRKPGPWLGQVMNRLVCETALGRILNSRTALLERVSAYETEDASHE